MSVRLSFVIQSESPRPNPDWASVGRTNLHYEYFNGGFGFVVNGVDFSTLDWEWVPVIDWALQLRWFVRRLEPGTEQVFEFTENEFTIVFRRVDDEVEITATYVDDVATVVYASLREAAESFADEVTNHLLGLHPELAQNEYFSRRAAGDESD